MPAPTLRGYKVVGRLVYGSMTSADEKQKEKKAPTTLDMERLYVQNSEFCWFSVRNYIYSVTSTKDKQKINKRSCPICLKISENIPIFVVKLCKK